MTSIAFPSDTASYITTLTQLVEEIRDEMDDSGFDRDRIYRAIGRAESMFNRELRVPQMETEIDIAVTQEGTDLPQDFLALRAVYQEGAPDRTLKSYSPAGIRELYQGRSGTPEAYAIENRRVIIGPVGTVSLTVLYYAKVPPLTDNNPTNWLLVEYPDIYLHQVLAILFAKTGDRDRAADNLGLAMGLIERANSAGRHARWGASPLAPVLVQQVRGSRI